MGTPIFEIPLPANSRDILLFVKSFMFTRERKNNRLKMILQIFLEFAPTDSWHFSFLLLFVFASIRHLVLCVCRTVVYCVISSLLIFFREERERRREEREERKRQKEQTKMAESMTNSAMFTSMAVEVDQVTIFVFKFVSYIFNLF